MRAGKLDRVVYVERVSVTYDELRAPVEAWTRLFSLRAEAIQNGMKDFLLGGEEHASRNTIVFRTRFVPGITLNDRVSYGENLFKILEIKEIGRRRGLELRCERIGK
ncbi:head-tail adaptor protein [Labrys sp. 22185]|uniref:head-tail adaptor protein n=1 Tax=Labrys sp. 22185 TaxID=3453888 RepID=UPI003F86D88D